MCPIANNFSSNKLNAGRDVAQRVQNIVGNIAKLDDYRHIIKVAQIQPIQKDFSDTATLLDGLAIGLMSEHINDHAAFCCRQVCCRLGHLAPAFNQNSQVPVVFCRVVQAVDWSRATEALRRSILKVVTFCGFSGAGYEYPAAVEHVIRKQLTRFAPQTTAVCAGATAEGIGMVYPIAKQQGFRTIGIVSSLAEAEGMAMSDNVEIVYVVKDDTWGGWQGTELSPTSEAMVEISDEMIGIGGGTIARDELEEARKRGKPVKFFPAEMNHALAVEKARKAGKPPPDDFHGKAHVLFAGTGH
jgi:hypothetical protein